MGPKLLTAISDLEVQEVEVKGQLWYFRYPIEGSDRFITVATTRQDDARRYRRRGSSRRRALSRSGGAPRFCLLVDRRIPVVAILFRSRRAPAPSRSPRRGFNDFEVARRHDLPMVNILAADGTVAARR